FYLYLKCIGAQAPAAAVRALCIPAIAAQEHPHVQLVLLALQPCEEPLYSGKLFTATDHALLLLGIEVAPRRVYGNVVQMGELAKVCLQAAVFGLGPRLDGAFGQRFGRVRNHQAQVEVNGIAESLAARASPKGVVKREQTWLRFLIGDAASLALEPVREAQLARILTFTRHGLEYDLAAFPVRLLHGVHDARALVAGHGDPVHQDVNRLAEIDVQQRLRS